MIVVADASPLIFLAKIRRLRLVTRLLGHDIRIPRAVRNELLQPEVDPAEMEALEEFIKNCRIETVRRPRRFASAMSRADNEALTLAVRSHADIILCDERAMRIMAESEGVRPLGTLGILLRSVHRKIITAQDAKQLIDRLIRSHGFRIGVEVYQAVLAELEAQ
jgi:predicted nucleic acid-binding protein